MNIPAMIFLMPSQSLSIAGSLAWTFASRRGRDEGVADQGGRVAMADAVVGLQPVDKCLVPGQLAGANEVEPVADGFAVFLLDRGEVEGWSRDALRHSVIRSVRCRSGW